MLGNNCTPVAFQNFVIFNLRAPSLSRSVYPNTNTIFLFHFHNVPLPRLLIPKNLKSKARTF